MSRRFQNGRFSRIALTRSYIPAAWRVLFCCSIRTYTAAIACYNNITARRQGRGSQVVRSTRLTRSSPHPLTTTVHTKLEIMSAAIHVIKGRLVTGLSLQDSRFGRGAPMAKRMKQRTRGADRRQSSSSNYPQISSCACRVPTVSVLACAALMHDLLNKNILPAFNVALGWAAPRSSGQGTRPVALGRPKGP